MTAPVKPRLLFDIGSTYFKMAEGGEVRQFFRDFRRPIYDDLMEQCGAAIRRYSREEIFVCSSANGGLSTLIVGWSQTLSLRFAVNVAFNSGINIIDTVLWSEIETAQPPVDQIDVVILVGGIDGVGGVYDQRLLRFLERVSYHNLVYAGSADEREWVAAHLKEAVLLPNLVNDRLRIEEKELKHYLTELYQADIVGKEEIKRLYEITAAQIYPTPYVVNQALPAIRERLELADPFVLIDIGGATTDIHYSRDLVGENLTIEGGYDRLVFKKLGVYKSRASLVHTARANEFVYELLAYLGATEAILEERSEAATKVLMQLAIFLVLYKVSHHHSDYVELRLERLNALVLTGGASKLLRREEVETVLHFFYRKLLHFHQTPPLLIDRDYEIWTYGLREIHSPQERKEKA